MRQSHGLSPFFRRPGSRISRRALLGALGPLSATSLAQNAQQPAVGPYAKSGKGKKIGLGPVPVREQDINVVSAHTARFAGPLEPVVRNFMRLWVEKKATGECQFTWELDVERSGAYEVRVLLRSEKPCRLDLQTQDGRLLQDVEETGWQRVNLGSLDLNAGKRTLRLAFRSEGFQISALELVRPATRQHLQREAASLRSDPDWFKDAGYGVMFQWTNRAAPRRGEGKPWEQKVNDFDLNAFLSLIEESGASYVIWSMTWGQQYISAPIRALDDILHGRTTRRDLLGEMAERLAERNIKLMFYYHYGYDCYHSKDPEWMKASGAGDSDRTRFYRNWQSIISEVAERYGEKLHGWFYDGGQRYYDCHFDNSANRGLISAPFQDLTQAAKKGNARRIVGYNPWILPSLTLFEDYFCGEGFQIFDDVVDGRFTGGSHRSLQAHACFPLERRWGHIDRDIDIEPPRYTAEELVSTIRHAHEKRYPVSINLEMYEDGSVSPRSLELMKEVRRRIRGK